MQDSFVIKYEYRLSEGLNLALIGESFAGFDSLLKEILETARLNDTVEVKATRVQQGSIEVYNTIVTLAPVTFTDPQVFLEFLRVAAPELLKDANTFFSTARDVHRTVNDYFARNPVDMTIATLIVGYFAGVLRTSGKLKQSPGVPPGSKASPQQIKRYKRIIEGGKYKRALAPVTEGVVSSIELRPTMGDKEGVKFNEANVGNYLPDDDKVLPELRNGDIVQFTGELLSLQSTHGDSIKIRIDNIDPHYSLLTGTPADGTEIESYKHLFKQRVVLEAEIVRKTDYKRPDLVIISMSEQQESLNLH